MTKARVVLRLLTPRGAHFLLRALLLCLLSVSCLSFSRSLSDCSLQAKHMARLGEGEDTNKSNNCRLKQLSSYEEKQVRAFRRHRQ